MFKMEFQFTNPEQSKLLLRYGIPMDTADCVIKSHKNEFGDTIHTYGIIVDYPCYSMLKAQMDEKNASRPVEKRKAYLPCWSLGRLAAIYRAVTGLEPCTTSIEKQMKKFNDLHSIKFTFNWIKLKQDLA